MRAHTETAVDGTRLVKVRFRPQVENPASQAEIEVVFELKHNPHFLFKEQDPVVLFLLSATTIDTREPYTLSREQRTEVLEAALGVAATDDGEDWS